MIRALGVSVNAIDHPWSGARTAWWRWSGALLAQYQGFADVQMGIGMVVWGLAERHHRRGAGGDASSRGSSSRVP